MAERNVGILGLITSGLQGGDNLLEYIKKNAKTEEDMAYLRDKAGLMASDYWTGLLGHPFTGLTNIDELITGNRGSYRGQTLGVGVDSDVKAAALGIEVSPDLLSIYLGEVTPESQGLKLHTKSPSKGYPFAPGPVYNIEDYVFFDGLNLSTDDIPKLFNLKRGEVMKLNDDQVAKYSSIDLGTRSNWSVGRDEEGYYVAIADIWDFAGDDYGSYQKVMDYVGGAPPLNMYGRFPLDIEGDVQVEQY